MKRKVLIPVLLIGMVLTAGCMDTEETPMTEPPVTTAATETPTPDAPPTALTPARTPTAVPTATITATPESTSPGTGGRNIAVSIQNSVFDPASVTVSRGDTVTWTNLEKTEHTVSIAGVVSPRLDEGDSFSYTFNEPGNYEYICSRHPFMKGTVTVTG